MGRGEDGGVTRASRASRVEGLTKEGEERGRHRRTLFHVHRLLAERGEAPAARTKKKGFGVAQKSGGEKVLALPLSKSSPMERDT